MVSIFKSKKDDKNYLDFIAVKNPDYTWKKDDKDMIVVEVVRKGFFNKIAEKIFKVPQKTDVMLDEYGSFIWLLMDGKKSIFDISKYVSENFGEDAEPLMNRLVQFFKILHSNAFITFIKE